MLLDCGSNKRTVLRAPTAAFKVVPNNWNDPLGKIPGAVAASQFGLHCGQFLTHCNSLEQFLAPSDVVFKVILASSVSTSGICAGVRRFAKLLRQLELPV